MTTPYIALYIDTVNRNRFVIASDFARFATIDEMMQEKYGSPCTGARKLLNSNGNLKYAKMLRKSVEELYKKAKQLINEVELGMYDEEQMYEAEFKIAFCLAAIEDAQLARILEKDDDYSVGR